MAQSKAFHYMNSIILRKIAYQDVWIKGRNYLKGVRDCSYRFEFVREFCTHFDRPITVLDIGANMGYYSIRLAEHFPGTYVMFEGGGLEQKYLKEICIANKKDNFVVLPHYLNLQQILQISQSHTFDLVLAFSVVHHFKEPYQKVVEGLMQLGSYVMLELPQQDEGLAYGQRVSKEPINLERYRHELLTRTPYMMDPRKDRYIVRDFYLVETPQRSIKPCENEKIDCLTNHDFQSRQLYNPQTNTTMNAPEGINFAQFLDFKGSLPTKDWFLKHLEDLDVSSVSTINPWNIFICEGALKIYSVDESEIGDSKKDLEKMIELYKEDRLNRQTWSDYLNCVDKSVDCLK